MIKSIIALLIAIAFASSMVWIILTSKRYEKEMFEDLLDMSERGNR